MLVRHLPPEAAVNAFLEEDGVYWGLGEELAASTVELLHSLLRVQAAIATGGRRRMKPLTVGRPASLTRARRPRATPADLARRQPHRVRVVAKEA